MAYANLPLIHDLLNDGHRKMVLLVRHGARHYDPDNPSREFEMMLTLQGRRDAYELGTKLPVSLPWRFLSSPVGRCIETAHYVEEGCIASGAKTVENIPHDWLGPHYFPDMNKMFRHFAKLGFDGFVQSWMKGDVPSDIALHPDDALFDLLDFLSEHLNEEGPCFAATHDMTIHLARRALGTELDRVHYLNGVLFFEKDGTLQMSDGDITAPVPR